MNFCLIWLVRDSLRNPVELYGNILTLSRLLEEFLILLVDFTKQVGHVLGIMLNMFLRLKFLRQYGDVRN